MGVPNNRSHVRTSPVTISISEIFKNVNPNDKDFIKYIPQQFFEDEEAETELPENIEILSLTKDNDKRRHTTLKEQQYIQKICDKLGIKIEFEDVYQTLIDARYNMHGYIPDGYYDRVTRVLHIGYTVANPIKFIFKHELTHYCEGTESFKRFVEAVRKTRAYKKWLKKQCGFKGKVDLETLEDGYVSLYNYERPSVAQAKVEDISGGDMPGIVTEPVCDFVGDCLFTEKGSGLEALRNDLDIDVKERNVIVQYIRDFFRFVKERLSGHKISLEISRLENRFNRALSEAKFTEPAFGRPMDDIKFSVANSTQYADRENLVEKYTETQYNNFGWVRYNDVLSPAEYSTLLSRYADYKHNKDHYPTTRFGEAVIYSFDYPNILMYVKGAIRSPQITKILKIDSSIPDTIQIDIQKEILSNERNNLSISWENVTFIFGEESININKKRDFPSFQEYKRRKEGELSREDNPSYRIEQDGARVGEQSTRISEQNEQQIGGSNPDIQFSVPTEARMLLNSYESGEITREEYHQKFDELWNKTISEMEDRVLAEKSLPLKRAPK